MKTLLEIQREVKELEITIQDSLNRIHTDIQEIRTSDDGMDMDYDMIRTLARNVPFKNHPLSHLEDRYACKVYTELLFSVMHLDSSGIVEKMAYIQWILEESRLDMVLEDVRAESMELKKNIYSEMGEVLDTEYRLFFIVDALIIANFVSEANRETIEYIAQLCALLGVDASHIKTSVILAKIALEQDIINIDREDVEKVLPFIRKYEYCIRKEIVEKAFIVFRDICVKVYNEDLWGGYSLSWKVEQKSKVNKGDKIAEYRLKQGSTTDVWATKDGMLFQIKAYKSSSYGSFGVISHSSDSGTQIATWLTEKYKKESVSFEFVNELSNRYW